MKKYIQYIAVIDRLDFMVVGIDTKFSSLSYPVSPLNQI